MKSACRWEGDRLFLAVRVQPRSSREGVIGLQGTTLKIALTAPPVDGAANKALCRWLASELKVAKGKITIERGHRSREKQLLISNANPATVAQFCKKWHIPEPD